MGEVIKIDPFIHKKLDDEDELECYCCMVHLEPDEEYHIVTDYNTVDENKNVFVILCNKCMKAVFDTMLSQWKGNPS